MGFGLDVKVDAPKIDAPKVEAPKLDVAGAVGGAVAGAAAAAKSAVEGVVGGALGAVGKAAASLAGVAGALAEVAVSFKGAAVDLAMEPHVVLDANASFGDTNFEKGPVWIRVDLSPEKAKENQETLHLRSDDGAFDAKKMIKEFTDKTSMTVDVLFEEAPMDQTYSLDVIDENGKTYNMFAGISYGDLRKTKNRF